MRINSENKTMDLEARDINYILPAYLRSYQFHSQNELPTKIIFPMFPSVKAANGVDIPIEYVPPLEAIAVEIAENGKSVAEVTPAQEAALDEKDAEIARLKTELAQILDEAADKELEEDTAEPKLTCPLCGKPSPDGKEHKECMDKEAARADQPESPARKAFETDPDPSHQPPPDRQPKQPPGGDIGVGQPPSDMQPRDRRDQVRTAKDLLEEPSIEEAPEKEFDKEIKRDEKGNPIVEDKGE